MADKNISKGDFANGAHAEYGEKRSGSKKVKQKNHSRQKQHTHHDL
ncbi:small acid-soluble spore protein P [Bacillaceae bacterium S4-13-58]